jgi:DNA helicase-2/ATP-dependent DNA helicase PcrA
MPSRTTLFGPPGSGKTTTLTKWAQQAAAKHGGENIMVCSLTKTAAIEIQSRNTMVPKENVGTLHAHAYRSVTAEFEGRYKVITDKDRDEFNSGKPVFKQLTKDRITEDSDGRFGDTLPGKVSLFRAQQVPIARWPVVARNWYDEYVNWKEANSLIDFTDMIDLACKYIDCPLDYIILDEAQDCSSLEYALLEKWAGQCEGVVIAGDDDQAAYEWRGASVNAFLGFAEDQRVLPRSYRLPLRIKEHADRWIHQIKNRKEKTYESTDETGHVSEMETRHPAHIVEEALSLPGTTMILATCAYMLNPVLQILQEEKRPYHNPYRVKGDYASTWNPLLRGDGTTVTAADAVRAFMSPPWSFRLAHAWIKEMSSEHLSYGTKAELKRERSNDSLVPLEHISRWLGAENLASALQGDLQWWMRCVKDPKRRASLVFRHNLLTGMKSLNETPTLIVGTIHSVKGGQADNVILMPDLSLAGKEAFLGNPDPVIRQMYVGMTRAKERLILVRPARRAPLQW